MHMQKRESKSLGEFLRILEETETQEDLIFRGQRRGWSLLPKIARKDFGRRSDRSVLELERMLFEEFCRKARPHVPVPQVYDSWDWLAMAQHHGLATRLLDWTTNALAAIWFAVEKPPEDETPGIVYILQPSPDDFLDTTKLSEPFKVPRTQVIRPPHSNPRIAAQTALFTVHAYHETFGGFIPLQEDILKTGELIAVQIPADRFWMIRYDLDRCGVNRHSLFPGLEGLSQYVNWLYTEYSDEKNKSRMSIKRI